MGWFFNHKDDNPTENKAFDELKLEQDLVQELPNDLVSFYHLKSQENSFKFPNKPTRIYNESELAGVNCADFQAEYVNCITNGRLTEKLDGCAAKMVLYQDCLKFQKELFFQLGLRYCANEKELDKVLAASDELAVKWIGTYDPKKPLSHEILKEVYDERDKIWKPN